MAQQKRLCRYLGTDGRHGEHGGGSGWGVSAVGCCVRHRGGRRVAWVGGGGSRFVVSLLADSFEVKVNGKLVYSKLELGGLPELDDVSSLPGTDSTPVTTTLPLLLLSPPSLATGRRRAEDQPQPAPVQHRVAACRRRGSALRHHHHNYHHHDPHHHHHHLLGDGSAQRGTAHKLGADGRSVDGRNGAGSNSVASALCGEPPGLRRPQDSWCRVSGGGGWRRLVRRVLPIVTAGRALALVVVRSLSPSSASLRPERAKGRAAPATSGRVRRRSLRAATADDPSECDLVRCPLPASPEGPESAERREGRVHGHADTRTRPHELNGEPAREM
ncbi:unnamed protein product [Lampetra fluviatilis]